MSDASASTVMGGSAGPSEPNTPPEKTDQELLEERAAAIFKAGFLAGSETDDNSVFNSDPAFVGIDPEYRNYANEQDKPMWGDPAAGNAVKAHVAQLAADSTATPIHPSVVTDGAGDLAALNRAALAGQAAPVLKGEVSVPTSAEVATTSAPAAPAEVASTNTPEATAASSTSSTASSQPTSGTTASSTSSPLGA